MEGLIIYILICLFIGVLGDSTTLGFGSAFLLSILLTPVGGFFILLFYPSKKHREKQLAEQKKQSQLLQQMQQPTKLSHADEILKLKKLFDDGAISAGEYEKLKAKIMD